MIEVNAVLQFILTWSLCSTVCWNVWLWSVSDSRRLHSGDFKITTVRTSYFVFDIQILFILGIKMLGMQERESVCDWFMLMHIHHLYFLSVIWGQGVGLCACVHFPFLRLISCAISLIKLDRKAFHCFSFEVQWYLVQKRFLVVIREWNKNSIKTISTTALQNCWWLWLSFYFIL